MAPAEPFLLKEEFGSWIAFNDFDPCYLDPLYALTRKKQQEAEALSAPAEADPSKASQQNIPPPSSAYPLRPQASVFL